MHWHGVARASKRISSSLMQGAPMAMGCQSEGQKARLFERLLLFLVDLRCQPTQEGVFAAGLHKEAAGAF